MAVARWEVELWFRREGLGLRSAERHVLANARSDPLLSPLGVTLSDGALVLLRNMILY